MQFYSSIYVIVILGREYFVPPINAEPRLGDAIFVPVIYTDHVPAAFSAINKLVVVTLPLPQLTVCVSPLGLVIVRLCANIAPFPPITDALEQSTVTSFTIALSGRPLKLKATVLESPVTPGINAIDISLFADFVAFVSAANAVTCEANNIVNTKATAIILFTFFIDFTIIAFLLSVKFALYTFAE